MRRFWAVRELALFRPPSLPPTSRVASAGCLYIFSALPHLVIFLSNQDAPRSEPSGNCTALHQLVFIVFTFKAPSISGEERGLLFIAAVGDLLFNKLCASCLNASLLEGGKLTKQRVREYVSTSGSRHKSPLNGWLQTTNMFPFLFLKARSLGSRYPQGCAPSEALGRILPCHFLAFGGFHPPLPYLGLQLNHSDLCLWGHLAFSLCVSEFTWPPSSAVKFPSSHQDPGHSDCCCLSAKSCPTLSDPMDCQAPLSMEFPRQGYWRGLPFPSPGDLPDPGMERVSLASPTLAGRFFTAEPPGKPGHLD